MTLSARVCFLWTVVAVAAYGQKHRYEQIVAVPVPGAVVVDGDLSDWDLSGAIDSAFDDALRPRFSGRFALMYDAEALHVGAHLVDDSPLLNHHDPAVEPNRGWDADCLQVRLNGDPQAPYPSVDTNAESLCHLDLWSLTDSRLPVLKVAHGMDFHDERLFTGTDSGLAFRADADGKGYTVEARVPWDRLGVGAAPPKAGDRIAFTLQPLWSDGSGWKQVTSYYEVVRGAGFAFQTSTVWGQALFSATGNLTPTERSRSVGETAAPLTLGVALPDPEATSVSLALFADDGTLVRSLPVGAGGQQTMDVRWDGLDDDGRPLPVGTYTIRLLSHRGLGQKWVTSLHNAGEPPWRTDDGRGAWGGDHGAPIAAAADASRVYLGWEISEAGTAIIAVEPKLGEQGTPRKLWGRDQVLDLGMLVQALASDGERLFVAQDGRRWGQGEGGTNTAGVVLWDTTTAKPVNFPFGKRILVVSEWDPGTSEALNLAGIAVRGDLLYASLNRENKLVALNWRTGQKVAEQAVDTPRGLALDPAGRLLAVSGRDVLTVDLASGARTTLVSGLTAPHSLAVDAQGRIFVSDRGEAMQVRVFDAAGKPLGSVGKAGGRPAVGRYEPKGMLNPAGIAVDAEGKLWVTEQDLTPKRVSVWSAKGKLLADLLGPGAYAVEAAADLRRPEWINTHTTLFGVNYRTGAQECLSTLVRPEPGQIAPFGGFMGRSLRFAHAQGRDFVVWPGHGIALIYRLGKDLVARPVAAVGYLKDLPLYGVKADWFPPGQRANFEADRFAALFRWVDRNGDTKVQPEEMTSAKVPQVYHGYWGPWVEEDLTLWFPGAATGAWRLPVKEWLPEGVPVYPDPADQRPLFATLGECVHAMPGKEGVYVLERKGGNGQTAAGAEWMAVSRYTPGGRRLWAYRRTWTDFGLEAPLFRPGDVIGAMKFLGTATLDSGLELLAVNGYFGQFSLLSGEGLWVGALSHDNRYGPKADATTIWPENFSGFLFRHRGNGKVYLMAGDTDARIWEITGLETIRTSALRVDITPADRERALAAAAQRRAATGEAVPIALRPAGSIAVDGQVDEWDKGAFVTIDAGGGRSARAALAYDAASLYAAFDVADDSPMANAGTDAALLFKTGDTAEVMLATDPQADPRRSKPVAGDQRLLFSVLAGKPVAVLYQPVAPAGLAPAPRDFRSPTGAETFARVLCLETARVVIGRSERGYRLEAAVPLAELGLKPVPGTALRGDLGVIFSDAGGSRNALRAYRFNSDTAIVNDIPSEARLQPAQWGAVRVE